MTNYRTGHDAEQQAAEYLATIGFAVISLNWRTRYCEIDIVAKRQKVMYFFEVKYRRTLDQGEGINYITSKKLDKMRFAAEMWVNQHNWKGEYQLSAISISGQELTLIIDL